LPAGPERAGGGLPGAAPWLLGAALVLPCLAVWRFPAHPPALIQLKEIAFLLPCLAGILVLAPFVDLRRLARSPALVLAAAFVLAGFLSAAASDWPATAWRGALRWLALAAFAWAVAAAFSRGRRAARALDLIGVVGGLLAALFLVQLIWLALAGKDPFGLTSWQSTDLPSATFANRNQLATLLVFIWPWFLLTSVGREGRSGATLLRGAAGLLCLCALGLTFTEGAMAGAAASLLLLGARAGRDWLVSRRPLYRAIRTASAVLLAAFLVATVTAVLLLASAGPRLAGQLPRTATILERAALWNLAWKAGVESPVLGHGPGTFDLLARERAAEFAREPAWRGMEFVSRYAHDDVLETAATMGVPAALLLVALFGAALGSGWKALRDADLGRKEVVLGTAAGLTGLLVHALVHYPLQLPSAAALALGGVGILAGSGATGLMAAGPAKRWRLMVVAPVAAVLLAVGLLDLRAAVSMDRALQSAAAGRLDAAEKAFQETVRLRPDWSPAWNDLAAVRLLRGEPKAAREALERARALAPSDPDVLSNLAAADELEGRAGSAIDLYDQALRINPSHIPSLLGKARVLGALGRGEEAIALYRLVLEVDGDNAPALSALEALGEDPAPAGGEGRGKSGNR